MSPEAAAAPRKRATTRKTAGTRRTTTARAKRKAPTPKQPENNSASYIKFYAALLFAFVIVTSISVFIGTRDQGIIDVKATISARAALEEAKGNTDLSEAIRSAGRSQTVNKEVDDALVGAGNKVTEQQKNAKKTPKALAVTASSTASSTTATSTDEVGEQGSDEESDSSEEEEGEEDTVDESAAAEEETNTEANTEESADDDMSEPDGDGRDL